MDLVVIPSATAARARADRLLESGAIESLQQVVERMDFKRAERIISNAVTNTTFGIAAPNVHHDFKPIALRHLNVKKHKVGMRRANGINHPTPVAGFANHNHVRLPTTAFECAAWRPVIVHRSMS